MRMFRLNSVFDRHAQPIRIRRQKYSSDVEEIQTYKDMCDFIGEDGIVRLEVVSYEKQDGVGEKRKGKIWFKVECRACS